MREGEAALLALTEVIYTRYSHSPQYGKRTLVVVVV